MPESVIRKFLIELFGAKNPDFYLNIWRPARGASLWFKDVEEAIAAVEQDPHQDTYVGLYLSAEDRGRYRRCSNDLAVSMVSVGTDHDIFSAAHKKTALPRTLEEAASVIPADLRPTIVISSGNGLQCHWVWRESLDFEGPEHRDEIRCLYDRWHELIWCVSNTKGWAYDKLQDFARILRIPGTYNLKDKQHPKLVELIEHDSARRYNPGDLEEYLDMRRIAVPVQIANAPDAAEWARKFREENPQLNLAARIPEETLAVWLEQDQRFRATWMRDPQQMDATGRASAGSWSQSEWDLSLANFGVRFGCSNQQIIDMICHHRTLAGAKARTKIDYYQRTIGKARMDREGKQPSAADIAEPQQEADRVFGDPAMERARLCSEISAALKVISLVKVVKITGQVPSFLLHFDVGIVEVPNVYKLMDQHFMCGLIANVTNKLIPEIKRKDWRVLTAKMLEVVEEQSGGEENELQGRVNLYVTEYLNARRFIIDSENPKPEEAHLPTFIDGKVAISTLDLADFLNTRFRLGITANKLATDLTAIGATNVKVRAKHLRNQSRWLLPIDDHNFTHKAPEYDPEGIGHEPAEDEDTPGERPN